MLGGRISEQARLSLDVKGLLLLSAFDFHPSRPLEPNAARRSRQGGAKSRGWGGMCNNHGHTGNIRIRIVCPLSRGSVRWWA